MAVEKIKILGSVLNYQRKSTANSAHFAQFLDKWAKFSWFLQNGPQDFNCFNCPEWNPLLSYLCSPKSWHNNSSLSSVLYVLLCASFCPIQLRINSYFCHDSSSMHTFWNFDIRLLDFDNTSKIIENLCLDRITKKIYMELYEWGLISSAKLRPTNQNIY